VVSSADIASFLSLAYFKVTGLALGFTQVGIMPIDPLFTTRYAFLLFSRRSPWWKVPFTSHSHKIWNCSQDHADTD
jgi:hypothetical protein